MSALQEKTGKIPYTHQRIWNGPGELSPKYLVREQPQVIPLPERWRFNPFSLAVYDDPKDGRTVINGKKIKDPIGTKDRRKPVVDLAVNKLVARLTEDDLGNSLMPLTESLMDKRRAKLAQQVESGGIFERLAKTRFGQEIIRRFEVPSTKKDSNGQTPRVVIRPGTGDLDLLLHPLDYVKMPEPKPFFFYVSAVDRLPTEYVSTFKGSNKIPRSAEDFDFSRQQLVRAAVHNGVIFEINNVGIITGFWWFSTQGNHQVVRIDDEVRKSATAEELRAYERMLLDSVAMRFCVHNGDVFLTDRSDYDVKDGEEPFINWDRWSHHSIHHDLHQMAMEFREMDLLDDHVDVVEFTPDEPEHGKRIGKAINKSDLGEGMDSAKIGKVVAMSPSGGGKVDWKSDDPNKGVHLTPLSHMTSTGTVVYRPTGTPEEMETADGKREKVAFAKGSVEARENLDAYIMRQRYAGGQVQGTDRYQQLSIYESWQRGELNENNMIPVYQDGLPQEDFIMVHLHAMPDWVDEEKVQVVEPDYVLYPEVDMACGSRGGNGSFRSALSKSTWFTARADPEKHFLEDRWIIVKLKGHGIVLLAKSPQEAVRGVKKYTKMKRPIQETV